MRLLGKNPDDRISSAAEVIDCLRKFQFDAPRQRSVSSGTASSRWRWIIAGLGAALLAGLAVYISVQGSGEPASSSGTPTGGTSGFPDTPGTAEQPALKITPVVVRPLAESATADTPGSATGGETELLRGIRFNGTSSFIHVPSFQFSGKLPLTMEAWIVPELMGDLTRHICLLGHPGGGIGINASRLFGGGLNDALGWTDGYTSHPLESDCLYHVAVVFAAGKKTQVFVNGNWSGENNREALPNPVPVEPSLTIGKHMKDFREFYSGTLLELRLSDVERYQPSQSFRPKLVLETDPRTLLLFHLNELSGNEIIDSSGHGHHGILTRGERVVVTKPE